MATIVLRGGTLCVGSHYFPEGETEVPEDLVDDAKAAVAQLVWASVRDGDEPELDAETAEDEHAAVGEQPEAALPVSGESEVAAKKVEPEVADRGEKLAELVENDGRPAESPEKRDGGFACDECDKVLKTEQGLTSHKRLKHGE